MKPSQPARRSLPSRTAPSRTAQKSTVPRVVPGRWSSAALLRRDPRLLAFDVFGFALTPAVLDPDDVYRLVAHRLRRTTGHPWADYLDLRRHAEDQARLANADLGRLDFALAEVGEQLHLLLETQQSDAKQAARVAINTEVDLHVLINRPNPEAHQLYREAKAAGIEIAFLADSFLPRDLVARMLQAAGYGHHLVLVSSHEGRTKTTGELFHTLVERSGIPASRIIHLGPDHFNDVDRARDAGLSALQVSSGRDEIRHRVELGLTERTGLDSVGLAIAADRLADADGAATPTDIGFYAGGPFAVGFCAWVATLIDELGIDHVLFCGEPSSLLRSVTTTLRPDLDPSTLHDFGSVERGGDDAEHFVEQLGLLPSTSVLCVGTGWSDQPHRRLEPLLSAQDRVELTTAYIGCLEQPSHRRNDAAGETPTGSVRVWAFDHDPDCQIGHAAAKRIDVLSALLPATEAGQGTRSTPRTDLTAAEAVAHGVVDYAAVFSEWLRLGADGCSRAMTEPALRVIRDPSHAEAALLSSYRLDDDVEPWVEGLAALSAADERRARSARRLGRGLRRDQRPDHTRDQAS